MVMVLLETAEDVRYCPWVGGGDEGEGMWVGKDEGVWVGEDNEGEGVWVGRDEGEGVWAAPWEE